MDWWILLGAGVWVVGAVATAATFYYAQATRDDFPEDADQIIAAFALFWPALAVTAILLAPVLFGKWLVKRAVKRRGR